MSTTVAPQTPVRPRRFEALGALMRSATFDIGVLILLFWVLCALFGHWLVPHDPYASDPLNSLVAPSGDHWFGTDQLGPGSIREPSQSTASSEVSPDRQNLAPSVARLSR